jgi:hypothetical protein
MSDRSETLQIHDNPEESRYEARIGGHLAIAEYMLTGPKIIFTHTSDARTPDIASF